MCIARTLSQRRQITYMYRKYIMQTIFLIRAEVFNKKFIQSLI